MGTQPTGHRVRTAPLGTNPHHQARSLRLRVPGRRLLTAERTFFGLLTQADDQGRHRDHAAIIAGQMWVLRPEHTPADVEKDLAQLADAGLICRYKGPDDKRYLHIVTWRQHQKINRPSASRLPPARTTTRRLAPRRALARRLRGLASRSPHRCLTEPSVRAPGKYTTLR